MEKKMRISRFTSVSNTASESESDGDYKGEPDTVDPAKNEDSELEFSVNCAQLPLLCAAMYNEYDVDDVFLDRQFVVEELSYYATALLWIRLLVIKSKQRKSKLTKTELQILQAVRHLQFNLPEPLYIYLSRLGSLQDCCVIRNTRAHLKIPRLPVAITAGHLAGYHAEAVTEESHNLFEEIPCLGIAGDILMSMVSGVEIPNPPCPIRVPEGSAICWECVAGYLGPISSCRPEIRQRLMRHGISSTTFMENIAGTRLNLPYLCSLSAFIGKQKTFRIMSRNFQDMSQFGSPIQMIKTKPCCEYDWKIWTNRIVGQLVFSKTDLRRNRFVEECEDDACAFGFQLYKEDGPGKERMAKVANWSCLKSANISFRYSYNWSMPDSWYESRNARRNVPESLKLIKRCNNFEVEQNIQRCKFVRIFAKPRTS